MTMTNDNGMRCKQADPSECASGELTKDICMCCDVCAKAAGQVCGGLWGMMGTCASHLYCHYSGRDTTPNFNSIGFCKQKNPTSDCCERKVVKEAGEVYTLIVNSGVDALDVCLDSCVCRKEWGIEGITFCFKKGDQQVKCLEKDILSAF